MSPIRVELLARNPLAVPPAGFSGYIVAFVREPGHGGEAYRRHDGETEAVVVWDDGTLASIRLSDLKVTTQELPHTTPVLVARPPAAPTKPAVAGGEKTETTR